MHEATILHMMFIGLHMMFTGPRIIVILKNKNQQDATCYFIVLLIGSTCFGHCYAHQQELVTVILITTLVVSFLVCSMLEVRFG